MGGYVIADFKGIALENAIPKVIKGVFQKFDNAFKIGKPILCSNVNIGGLSVSFFANASTDSEKYNLYFATTNKAGFSLSIENNDNVTLTVVTGE